MCKKFIYSILTLVCLTACKKEVGQSKADDSIQQTDTVYESHVATVYGPLAQKKDTLVTINGSTYKIECSAVMDTLKKLSETVIRHDSVSNKVYKSDYTGYDVTYTISLSEASGTKRFTKTFTKSDFKDEAGKDALLQAMVELPHFHGYHPGFKALMFTLDFWIPETDIGDQCFIMIGMDGKVIEKSFNNNYGGGGPDGTIEVPTDNAFVLTCAKILNTNGKAVDLLDGKLLAHVKMINDHTILVVYDPEEGDTKDNARLIDSHGKVLKTFTYKGYYDLLGYVVPSYFEKTTGNYIMLDDQLDNLTVIPADNPLGIFTVSSKALSETKTNPEHGVIFDINTETSEQTFAMDTVTKAIRLVKQRK